MLYRIPSTPLHAPLLGCIAGIIAASTPITLYTCLGITIILGLAAATFSYYEGSLKKSLCIVALFTGSGFGVTYYRLQPKKFPEAFVNYRYTVLNWEKVQGAQWPFKITLQTCPKSWWELPLTFLIYTQKRGYITVGDVVRIPRLEIKEPKNHYFSQYLNKEGFDGSAFVFSLKTYTKEKPAFNPLRWVHNVKHYCVRKAGEVLTPETYALFLSVFLGNKDEQKETLNDMRPLFMNWGISHQLARSGLHLIFFIPLLMLLISMLPLPFFIREILALLIIGMYGLFSWTSISFLRACCCFFMLRIGMLFSFFMSPLHILMLTALLVLLNNPLQLFFLDFQLSFFLTLTLLWMNHVNQLRTLNDRKTLAPKKRIFLE